MIYQERPAAKPAAFKLSEAGVKKTFWFHQDEAEALRRTAFERRMKESVLVRRAVRRYLEIED